MPLKILDHHDKGFTLLELIVAVSVLLIVTGTMVANYNKFQDTQRLKQAASTLANDLRAAQSKAVNGEKPQGPNMTPDYYRCDELMGYSVSFSTLSGTSSYVIQAECKIGGSTQLKGDSQTIQLPQGITYEPVPSQPIVFYTLTRGASSAMTITLSGFNATSSIGISSSGDITYH